jgi:Ni,Fe-hydrogenase III large subunit/Ni,Fe-hydrogenase III component G
MPARDVLNRIKHKFESELLRVDIPSDTRLFLYIGPEAVQDMCRYIFRDLDARYVISIGIDDRPYTGGFTVAHNFAFESDHVLCSVLVHLPADRPQIPSISPDVPAANWAEREFRDLVGIEAVGCPSQKRLILPDGWPDGVYPLRKDVPWDFKPGKLDDTVFSFDDPPEGCVVVPFGPFHPTLDEPAHFRLYVDGETVRGCEYRGFMVHRGIEKLADTVLTYNEIPMMAERICGICGCVHSVTYAQAVEQAAALQPTPRAEFIRTIMLEIERLHSHLLWVGLANHILGFDTLFMQSFRMREPIMWLSERITGNRKTYGLCVIGGVRWDITPEIRADVLRVLDQLEKEWTAAARAVRTDRNLQKRTKGVGIADKALVKNAGLIGPVARAAGVPLDCRRDFPYAAYDRVEFDVITQEGCDVWSRVLIRVLEVFESIRIIRQCLERMPEGPIQLQLEGELPVGRIGISSIEAPRGESHHFVMTGEDNRPRRWRVRAPTYQNLQGIPAMIKDQQLADMTISLGSIDPCFSCTDRLEITDIRNGEARVYSHRELVEMVRGKRT